MPEGKLLEMQITIYFLAWASVFRFSFVLASGPVSVVASLSCESIDVN